MRIALVSDTYLPQVNGVTTVVRRIADTVRSAAHDVALVAPRYPHGSGDDGGGGEELRVPSLPFPPYPNIRLSFPLHRHVALFLDRFAPDLVHVATEGPLGIVGRRYPMNRALPLVTSFHTGFPQYARDYGFRFLTHRSVGGADATVIVLHVGRLAPDTDSLRPTARVSRPRYPGRCVRVR